MNNQNNRKKYYKNNLVNYKNRESSNSDNAQMILLMGILLAISVILISSIGADIADLDIGISTERSSSLLTEFIHIQNAFGPSFNYNLVDLNISTIPLQVIFYGNMTNENITEAFNKTRNKFYILELQHDILFDAYLNDYWYTTHNIDGTLTYSADVTLELDNGLTKISRDIVYLLICKPYTK